jgi:hypothetical protein
LEIEVRKYEERYREQWEDFIDHSANGTFLHRRSFMEYHGDRFEDASVMVWEGEELVAVFPAHREGDQIFSHNGLSFGGWIYKKDLNSAYQQSIVHEVLGYYKNLGYSSISIFPVPFFYHQEEVDMDGVLKSLGFGEGGSKEIYVIKAPFHMKDKGKKKGVRRANRKGLQVKEEEVSQEFWQQMLEPMYLEKMEKLPVHSWEEIQELSHNHPGKIMQVSAYMEDRLLAALVIFKHAEGIKVQYSAVNQEGRDSRAMDILMHDLLFRPGVRYIDMGTANDAVTGEKLESLAYWKESFGAEEFKLLNFHLE